MKNNRVTVTQFWVSMLICSLYAILFCSKTPSVWSFLLSAIVVLFNIFTFNYYNGKSSAILRIITAVYFTVIIIISVVRFNEYMYKALGYGPYWLITIIMLAFVFFCTVKDLEPVARAAGIIIFFVLAALIYIFVCCFNFTAFTISVELSFNFYYPLILLFPSACYIRFKDNIIPHKNYMRLIYAAITLSVTAYFMCLSAGQAGEFPFQIIPERAYIDVFRGADCMLLEILTVAGLYIAAIIIIALFSKCKKKYTPKLFYLALIYFLSLICLYINAVKAVLCDNIFIISVIVIFVSTVTFEIIKSKMNKNS